MLPRTIGLEMTAAWSACRYMTTLRRLAVSDFAHRSVSGLRRDDVSPLLPRRQISAASSGEYTVILSAALRLIGAETIDLTTLLDLFGTDDMK
jgi:hypothetical protein